MHGVISPQSDFAIALKKQYQEDTMVPEKRNDATGILSRLFTLNLDFFFYLLEWRGK